MIFSFTDSVFLANCINNRLANGKVADSEAQCLIKIRDELNTSRGHFFSYSRMEKDYLSDSLQFYLNNNNPSNLEKKAVDFMSRKIWEWK